MSAAEVDCGEVSKDCQSGCQLGDFDAEAKVIAVVGATGTGKSSLADVLARTLGGEVISADSMQVYRGMDIGTAKVPLAERSTAYHCIDLVDPSVPFTAAAYQRAARTAIEEVRARGLQPIVCGGTGLYVRAALDDFIFDENRFATAPETEQLEASSGLVPSPNTALRNQLTKQADEMGAEAFHAELAQQDPASAALIHPNNVRRVIRAFELLDEGTSYAEQQADFSEYKAYYATKYVGVEVSHEVLYEVVNRRVDTLMANGLLEEVQALVKQGYQNYPSFSQAIGYKELLGVLDGTETLGVAVERIKQATRRYAKRQRTWFKRDARITWIHATELHKERLAGTLSNEEFTLALQEKTLEALQVPQERINC
ncbi:MAG: tRNA (adenosine(37)-N6)-dimethylallyltransferase MiaA [Coriobacteriales bacterium]|nr:tRNA (adenosine(37)-N6)-dimethylallyltransferase MiaA [Coriobacteriales bacterium]